MTKTRRLLRYFWLFAVIQPIYCNVTTPTEVVLEAILDSDQINGTDPSFTDQVKDHAGILIAGLVGVAIVLVITICTICYACKRFRQRSNDTNDGLDREKLVNYLASELSLQPGANRAHPANIFPEPAGSPRFFNVHDPDLPSVTGVLRAQRRCGEYEPKQAQPIVLELRDPPKRSSFANDVLPAPDFGPKVVRRFSVPEDEDLVIAGRGRKPDVVRENADEQKRDELVRRLSGKLLGNLAADVVVGHEPARKEVEPANMTAVDPWNGDVRAEVRREGEDSEKSENAKETSEKGNENEVQKE